MSHEGLHEPPELLSGATRNLHRALVSLIEELEAIDWYQQRADACDDPALKAVLVHNRNEEVEHGMMTLEWLRRNDPVVDKFARRYLFKDADIIEIEEAADEAEGAGAAEASPPAPGSPDPVGGRGGSPRGPIAAGSQTAQGSGLMDGSLGIGGLRGP
jgi:uncharacterized protein